MNIHESIRFEDLTEEQIREVIGMAESELDRRRKSKLAEARNKIKDLANSLGMSLEELIESKPGRGRKVTKEVRFRNPANSSETWTGRGKRPHWLSEALKSGAELESFRVSQ